MTMLKKNLSCAIRTRECRGAQTVQTFVKKLESDGITTNPSPESTLLAIAICIPSFAENQDFSNHLSRINF